jgi:hypothetical protein
MSQEKLQEFAKRILADQALQEQLQRAENKESLVQLIIELAAGFTAEEVRQVLEQVKEQEETEVIFPLERIPTTSMYQKPPNDR